MKILYISQFYEPESIAPAFRATEHSRYWAQNGADVTVLTGYPNYPIGKIFEGYTVELLNETKCQGVRLLRSKLVAKPNANFFNRIQNGLSFLWYGLVNLRKNRLTIGTDYDVVFATSGTVFAGYLGYRFAKKLDKPFVIEYRDLTYSQLLATGTPETSLKYKMMKYLELTMAKKAAHVVVLTNSFKETLLADGINSGKITVIPNGADTLNTPKHFHEGLRLGYFGTMGLSQVLPETICTVALLQDVMPKFEYLLIGEGAARSDVEAALQADDSSFVTLLHGMPKDELEQYYADVDMTVVSLRRSEAFAGTLPSKIFQSWARGIPVLFIGPKGEASELIEVNNGGIALCDNDENNQMKLVEFFSSPDCMGRIIDMGQSSKKLMNQHYTRERLASLMLTTLETVIHEK